ncbi:MAG: glycosyltransferase family 2 protein [Candidatus Omnitrophota bacterium]|jgi:glycosyltransferase involved in cell wall biosynthesis|nr:MAG: glycosyltransferase family 2 protein [Candidatus Omnitrophota bacterium]
MPLLSVIVPVFNESKTIRQVIEKIQRIDIDKEIIVVDDGSTDGTMGIISELKLLNLKVIYHSSNRGKGAAFKSGLSNATGDYVLIQDADLEYNPEDYRKLISAIKDCADESLVLGVRFLGGYQGLFFHRLGNKALTGFLNLLYSSRLNDYATCYKLASRKTFLNLDLKANGFDIDVEIVCNAIKRKLRIIEVPVSYIPRSYKEGKKIRLNDAFWAIFYMIKYRFGG